MFDLKSKLLAKGLVTQEQIEKATSQKKDQQKSSKNHAQNMDFASKERAKALEQLKSQTKAEQYITIRKWVDFNRLDKTSHSMLDGEKFFLTAKDNQVTWLTLKPDVIEAIKSGQAGVIAYMSNHGLVHAVVPRDIAEDVGEVFSEWLKVLNDKN